MNKTKSFSSTKELTASALTTSRAALLRLLFRRGPSLNRANEDTWARKLARDDAR